MMHMHLENETTLVFLRFDLIYSISNLINFAVVLYNSNQTSKNQTCVALVMSLMSCAGVGY